MVNSRSGQSAGGNRARVKPSGSVLNRSGAFAAPPPSCAYAHTADTAHAAATNKAKTLRLDMKCRAWRQQPNANGGADLQVGPRLRKMRAEAAIIADGTQIQRDSLARTRRPRGEKKP